jgi:hypothetical protein
VDYKTMKKGDAGGSEGVKVSDLCANLELDPMWIDARALLPFERSLARAEDFQSEIDHRRYGSIFGCTNENKYTPNYVSVGWPAFSSFTPPFGLGGGVLFQHGDANYRSANKKMK